MGRPNSSRETKFSGANGDKEIFIFPVQLTVRRIGNHTRLIHTLLYVMPTLDEDTRARDRQQPTGHVVHTVYLCLRIKLHIITAQSGPVLPIILCHSH